LRATRVEPAQQVNASLCDVLGQQPRVESGHSACNGRSRDQSRSARSGDAEHKEQITTRETGVSTDVKNRALAISRFTRIFHPSPVDIPLCDRVRTAGKW